MRYPPRDYQHAAVIAVWNYLHDPANRGKNPLVLMPTGTGKSLTMAMLIWMLMQYYPHLRIINVTHDKKLIESNYRTMLETWAEAPAGIYSAGLGVKNARAPLTFAGIMSIGKRAATFGHVDFLFIDEAHLVGTSESATYVKFIKKLRERNPNLIVVGFTATGFRMGLGMLTDGEMFDDVAFDMSNGEAFVWLVNEGYLCRPVPVEPDFELDDSEIEITAGDFNSRQASDAMAQQNLYERAIDACISVAADEGRQACLAFAQSIDDAELIADMFTQKGYPMGAVHSKAPNGDDILAKFRRGEYWGVANMGQLTTGYDQPNIDLIFNLRLTRSPGLWVQMVGRGTRPFYAPGYDITTKEGRLSAILASPKQNCKVLDFCGNTKRLGPINYPNLPRRRGAGGGSAPVRTCPVCKTQHHVSVDICTECGYEFPPPERIERQADKSKLVADGVLDLTQPLPPPPPPEYRIDGVHRLMATRNDGKNGKRDTMRVDYHCGMHRHSAWLCFDHDPDSWPYDKARGWWKQHKGDNPVPTSVTEALERIGEITKPKFIKVWVNAKFPEIVGYDFIGTKFEITLVGEPTIYEVEPDPLEEIRAEMEKKQAEEKKRIDEMFAAGGGYYDDDIPF